MALITIQTEQPDKAQLVANRIRQRSSALANHLFGEFANIRNDLKCNAEGVSEAEVRAALGDDAAQLVPLGDAIKSLLIAADPAFAERLADLVAQQGA